MEAGIENPIRALSIEEYLEHEAESTIRYELVGGEIFARPASNERHVRLTVALSALLMKSEHRGSCYALVNAMKLKVAEDTVYYPDAMVICDPEDDDEYVKSNPSLVAEVLSPRTQATDMREKLMSYRRLPNLHTYLILFQDTRRVIRHYRDEQGSWLFADVSNHGIVPLPQFEIELTLDEIYDGIIDPTEY